MISKDDMIPLMLEACPSFRPDWDEFVDQWMPEEDKPLYLALSTLASHLISLLVAGDTTSLSRAFSIVERWHLEGDGYVREAAAIGLLEDLQNDSLHRSTTPQQFEPFLLPRSLTFWRKVERYWSHGDVVTFE